MILLEKLMILLYRYNSYIYKNYNGRGVSKIMSSLQKFHRRTNGGAPAVKLIGSEAPVAGSGYYLGLAGDGSSYMYVAPKSTEINAVATTIWGSGNISRNTFDVNNGLTNTNTLSSFGGTTASGHPAAYYAKNLTTGGYNTWYLPAKNELTTMFSNKQATPFSTANSFIADSYWSSTESTASNAFRVDMSNGAASAAAKTHYLTAAVRAVRQAII